MCTVIMWSYDLVKTVLANNCLRDNTNSCLRKQFAVVCERVGLFRYILYEYMSIAESTV